MIELNNGKDIKDYHARKRAQIAESFKQVEDAGAAKLITKAEFDELYPAENFERYSVHSLNSFRESISKAEGIENPDEAFKQATKDLKGMVVTDSGKKAIVFVRKKESGE